MTELRFEPGPLSSEVGYPYLVPAGQPAPHLSQTQGTGLDLPPPCHCRGSVRAGAPVQALCLGFPNTSSRLIFLHGL